MHSLPTIEEIVDTFQFFDDWEERYRYLIELGEQLPSLAPEHKSEANRVVGCVSNVWIMAEPGKHPDTLRFYGDSDAATVKGLVAILVSIFSGKSPADISTLDADQVFSKLGLYDHLSPTRHVGVYAMVQKVKAIAMSHDLHANKQPHTSSPDRIGDITA